MILTNEIKVNASPDDVFAALNDVERIVTCLPGAVLDGAESDNTYLGRVKVKVGPISAGYAGKVRFVEIDHENRQMTMTARGADTNGSGDAEAEILLSVDAASDGAVLNIRTDLLIRGKIAQFGKGAIVTVSNKILKQFATNLAGLLSNDSATDHTAGVDVTSRVPNGPATRQVPGNVTSSAGSAAPTVQELDGLSMLFGPSASRYAPFAALFALGIFQGWLLGRVSAQARCLKEWRRG